MIALSWCAITYGQPISGIRYIPSANYGTIAIAVDSLNTRGVGTNGVIFNVAPGHTEDITSPILLTATGTAVNTIVFQMGSSGKSLLTSNPLVRRSDIGSVMTQALEAQGDGIIIIQGGDFITFDGIDVQSTTDAIEYGYFLRKASTTDACKNVTIKNASITMYKGISPYVIGIYASNLDLNSSETSGTGITVASTGGRTENLLITGNTISNVLGGIAIRGYNHASPFTYMDQNNVIGTQNAGNIIRNFGGNITNTTFAVHLFYQTSPNVSYNIIDNVAGGGTDATAGVYGIWHQASNNVGNFVASNNAFTIGINSSASSIVTCIQATPAGQTNNSITIQNNTFAFGNLNTTGSSILITTSAAKANNITVTGNSTVGAINKTGASGAFTGYINNSGTQDGGTHNISNNNFSNITIGGSGGFTGIECRSNATQVNLITNNTISNITAGGTTRAIFQGGGAAGSSVNNNNITGLINTGGGSGAINNVVNAIMLGGATTPPVSLTCYNNTISDLRGAEPVYGIWNDKGTDNRIYQNNISGLKNNTASVGPIYGMIIVGGVTTTIYNNYISDLTAPTSTGDFVIMGIYISGGTNVYMYYNTIYLKATTSATTFGTAGVYAKTDNINFEMRNNIIVNKSERAGNTGFTVAFRRFDNNLYSYASASDNNDFYVSSNSSICNYIYCEGSSSTPVTAKDSTMADYKTRMYPREAASFNELPPFVNPVAIPYNLHINDNVATLCESGATTITAPAITVDNDAQARYPGTGYPNSTNPAYAATNPDVGADEFGGIRAYLPLSVNAVTASAVCPTGNEGSVDVTETGGIPPFSYLWSNGATTQDLNGLTPGTYSVTITDFSSATTSGSWTVDYTGTICNNTTVSGAISSSGCYNAYQTITVSGLTVSAPSGHVELIAGEKISMMPGTVVASGAWLYAHISNSFCPGDAPMISSGIVDSDKQIALSTFGFSIYPNPTNGNITLVQKGDNPSDQVKVEIYNMNGKAVISGLITGEKSREFSTSSLTSGVYFVKVVAGDHVETIKLIKTN